MSDFMETATAVEPVVRMLDDGGCAYSSAVIFEDGSGSIVVRVCEKDKANLLMKAHGVDLSAVGHYSIHNRDDYYFSIDIKALRKYNESLCPYCGKDTKAVPCTKTT